MQCAPAAGRSALQDLVPAGWASLGLLPQPLTPFQFVSGRFRARSWYRPSYRPAPDFVVAGRRPDGPDFNAWTILMGGKTLPQLA